MPLDTQNATKDIPLNKANIFLLDEILSDKNFHCILDSEGLSEIFENTNFDNIEAKIYAINQIKELNLDIDESFMNAADAIIYYAESKADADAKIRVIDSIKNEIPEYDECKTRIIAQILYLTNTKEKADLSCAILSKEKWETSIITINDLQNILENMDSPDKEIAELAHSKADLIIELENNDLLENEDIQKQLVYVFLENKKEDIEAQCKTIKMLKDKDLLKNKNVSKYYLVVMISRANKERYSQQQELIKLLEDKGLFKNKAIQENIGSMLYKINEKSVPIIQELVGFLEDKKLLGNKSIQDNIGSIILNIDKDNLPAKQELVGFLEDGKLLENKSIQDNIGSIILNIDKDNLPAKQELVGFLEDKKLLGNKSIQDNIGSIILNTNEHNLAIKQNLANILKERGIFENKNIQEILGDIINAISSMNKKDITELMEKFINSALFDGDSGKDNARLFAILIKKIPCDGFINKLLCDFDSKSISEFSKQINSKKFDIDYYELQNGMGYELIATKTEESKDDPKNKLIATVRYEKNKNEDAIIATSTNEIAGDTSTIKYKNSDNVFILHSPTDSKKDGFQIEIIKDEDKNIKQVFYTKKSNMLNGAYIETMYDSKDLPQGYDIVAAIRNKTTKADGIKGKKISGVKKLSNGATLYEQNLNYNGVVTKRKYVLQPDDMSYEYSYHIDDENGNSLLSLDRSFSQNGNKTVTNINGKEYRAFFDDKTKTIKITTDSLDNIDANEDDKYFVIDIKNIFTEYDKQGEDAKKLLDNQEEMEELFFAIFKATPADQLLILGNYGISKIDVVYSENSRIYSSSNKDKNDEVHLEIGFDQPIISHELGHAVDYYKCNNHEKISNATGHISSDKELIDIYNAEFKLFKEKYPKDYRKIIDYFSQSGGGDYDTGLAELIAEVNMLLTTFGHNRDIAKERAHYLVKYFPKTIAKVAELLGYNK